MIRCHHQTFVTKTGFFRFLLFSFTFFLPLFQSVLATPNTDEARQLFEQFSPSIFQILVVDKASSQKAAIGSGFLISDHGHIATNYHVISELIHTPQNYTLQYLAYDGTIGDLTIQNIDIVHDLAIVKMSEPIGTPLSFKEGLAAKGTRIFSLGNPKDLGMSIVEGTYNGLLEQSLYEKILFSGSLNSGMSGGPAIDRDGNVIGVNVSTAGNQLSFLVPIKYLSHLFQKNTTQGPVDKKEFHPHIEQQLYSNQNKFMTRVLDSKWELLELGNATVPGEISTFLKCWGDSSSAKESLFRLTSSGCSIKDNIFITPDFSTGIISYDYEWFVATDMNSFRLYNLIEGHFGWNNVSNRANKEQLTNFQCHTRFIDQSQATWKVAFCARQYKKYPTIYDIYLSAASVSEYDRSLIAHISLSGVSQSNSLRFMRRFLESLQWKN